MVSCSARRFVAAARARIARRGRRLACVWTLVVCALHFGGCAVPARTSLWGRVTPAHLASARVYVVRPGDTVPGVAARLGVSAASLCRLNGLGGHARLRPATRLVIPEAAHTMRARFEEAQRVSALGPAGFTRRLRWPVAGILTSPFGRRWGRPHDGIDIGAHYGTHAVAAADGEVVFAANHGGYGNVVILQHTGGMMTVYAHGEAILVRQGERVRAGEAVLRVGSTGHSTGPHLHFEVRRGTAPQNPLQFLPRA